MKKLDEKVVYNITNLSMEKLQILLDYLNTIESSYEYLNAEEQRSKYPGNIYLISDNYNKWYFTEVKKYNWPDVDALTLFEEDALKIGDTFEKDGFVCRVESEVEKWVYDKYQEAYYKTKEWYSKYIVITNKEFIAQLEKYSK